MTTYGKPILLTIALVVVSPATAAEFCVSTNATLQQALMMAGSNGEADTIQIEAGTYTGSSAVAFAYSTSEDSSLSVSGGWYSVPPDQLCVRQVSNPSATTLSGSDARQVLKLTGASGTSGVLSISNLTISNGFTAQQGAGLFIGGGAGFLGNIVVTRVIMERNASTTFGGGMSLYTEGIANVRNNMFLLNRCSMANCAFSFTANATDTANTRIFIGSNTVVGNACTSGVSCTNGGGRFGGSARALFYNNVFAANVASDISLVDGGGGIDLYYNNYVTLSGSAPSQLVGNIAYANPGFVDLLNDDLRPTLDSPLRNAGTEDFVLSTLDLSGEARINEGRVDIGAYENSDRIFANGFELVE